MRYIFDSQGVCDRCSEVGDLCHTEDSFGFGFGLCRTCVNAHERAIADATKAFSDATVSGPVVEGIRKALDAYFQSEAFADELMSSRKPTTWTRSTW